MNIDPDHKIWDTQCPFCEEWFKKNGLKRHMKTHSLFSDPMERVHNLFGNSTKRTLISKPFRYGNNNNAISQFIVDCRLGKKTEYHSKDYVVLSRKRYDEIRKLIEKKI